MARSHGARAKAQKGVGWLDGLGDPDSKHLDMRNDATNIARVILIKVAIAGLPCHVFIFIAVVRWKNMETMWFTLQCVLHENVGGCIITVNLQNLLLTVDLDNPWTVLFYSAGTSIHVSRNKNTISTRRIKILFRLLPVNFLYGSSFKKTMVCDHCMVGCHGTCCILQDC